MEHESYIQPKQRVFVTGGTGLIGSHLLFALTNQDYPVRVLYRSESQKQKVLKAFSFYEQSKNDQFDKIEWIKGDLMQPDSIWKSLKETGTIFHCAGMVSFDPRQKATMYKINVEGTEHLTQIARTAGVRRFCFVSSSSALGKPLENEQIVIDEETPWRDSSDLSAYAWSKYKAEQVVWEAAKKDMEVVIVNPTIVIGPGDWERSSARLFRSVWNGMPFYGTGTTGFVDVRDVVKAMMVLCKSDISNERFVLVGENKSYQEVFNLISDHFNKRRPYIKMTRWMGAMAWRSGKLISQVTGSPPFISRAAIQAAQKNYFFSNQKLKKHIAIEFTPIVKSIEDTCQYFLREN